MRLVLPFFKILKNFKTLFFKKVYIAHWQINLLVLLGFGSGIIFSFGYLLNSTLLPRIFATSAWTQTDWSGGVGGSTTNQYSAGSGVDSTVAGQVSESARSGWASDYLLWGKRMSVVVTNTGSSQANYPTKMSVTYNSAMKADFGDIRFTNSIGSTLGYWVQSQTDSTTAVVWVKIDSLAGNSDTTIYMYYGNSVATTASNGSNTFSFFDDFNDGVLDPAKWTKQDAGNKITEGNGKLQLTFGSGAGNWDRAIYTIPSFTRDDWSLEFDMKWTSDYSPYDAMMWGWKDDGGGVSYTNLIYGHYNQGDGSCTTNCSSPFYESGGGVSSTTWNNNTDYVIRDRMRAVGGHYYEKSIDGGANFTTSYTSSYSTQGTLHPAFMLYSGDYLIDNLRVRKWVASEPTAVFSAEENLYATSATLTSNIFDTSTASDWGVLTLGTSVPSNTTLNIKIRTSNSASMIGASGFELCSTVSSGADISTNNCVYDANRYVQYQVTFGSSNNNVTATLFDFSLDYSASDQVAPISNATSVTMAGIGNTQWTKTLPTIGWTAGTDNDGGSGILGYCVALDGVAIGASSNLLEPASTSGNLSGLNDNVVNNYCPYIVAGNSLDLSSIGLTLTSNQQYNFSLKSVDNAGNIYSGSAETYQDLVSFYYDNIGPTNVSYITTASQNFSNVADMFFSWPISGNGVAADSGSGLLGWQYQINSTNGTWKGSATSSSLGIDYIPLGESTYYLTQLQDGANIVPGSNTIYFRTVDIAGNFSSNASIRTGAINFGGAAPAFGGDATVTITPDTSTSNSYGVSYPTATASGSNTVAHYYYMINTSPPALLTTLQGNPSTYIDNGTSVSVATAALPNINKGTNTIYVVAIDNAATPNYSPSNSISGTFTLTSTDPDNVANLVASDSSIKSQSNWNVTLTWTAPVYQGAGNLNYDVYRSSNGTSYAKVGTTTGLSYVDNTPLSAKYYYKIYTVDGAETSSSGTNAVSITPTGKWTTAPSLQSGPTVSGITTKKATIAWSTDRSSDSKVSYGTGSGSYFTEEPSNSSQVTSHTISLTNLNPGTTYYYKVKWTDEDGNTGTSEEKTFSTEAAPVVTDPKAKSISISSAILEYTVKGAAKVKIYYGKTTSFGAIKEVITGTSEGVHTTELIGLEDGTKYFYKINTFDSESSEYEGNVLALETLPRPRITNVRIQEVRGTAQPTVLVTWTTNTEVSSIITYYPQARVEDARDEINVALTKGDHKLVLKGLFAQTPYVLLVKGRDKVGNEAESDRQTFTTATDTRPPAVIDLKIQGTTQTISGSQEVQTQLVVSWNTDEPSSSQVEYGEGSGSTYTQKTQEDTNLTVNHLVIISGLTPSKVYHLRALSKDLIGNQGNSIDTVTITPKANDNAFNLVISNLTEAFGFLGGLRR